MRRPGQRCPRPSNGGSFPPAIPASASTRRWCSSRRAGPDTAVFYRIFNADGLEVEQCGNGARCIAALLHRRGRAPAGAITMDSPAGLIHARIQGAETGLRGHGRAEFRSARRCRSTPPAKLTSIRSKSPAAGGDRRGLDGQSARGAHRASVDAAPVDRLGPAIESHRRFPKRVNVGFMEIVDRSHIRLRVYERGTGETLACGTGACAAVAVGRRHGRLDADVHVRVRGGELRVNWAGPGEHIWLTGPAEVSFEGRVEVRLNRVVRRS